MGLDARYDAMMRSARFILITAVGVLITLASSRHAAAQEAYTPPAIDLQAVQLRPQPAPGRTTRYWVWTQRDQTMTMSAAGNRRTLSNRMEVEGECVWRIVSVQGDGGFTATMTMDWMTVVLTMPDGSVQRNDSRRGRGETQSLHTLLQAMCGVAVTCDVAADGTIRSVRGTDAIRRKAGEVPAPDDLDYVESATDLATLAGAPASLAAGRGWATAFAWSHDLGTMRYDMRYTLAGVEEIEGIPVANVTGQARMKLDVDRSKIPKGGPAIDIRLQKSSFETQVMFDLVRHEAVGRHTTDSRTIATTIRLPNAAVSQTTDEVIRSQVLRIGEE